MKIRDQHLLKLNSKPVQFPHYGLYERQDHGNIIATPAKFDVQEFPPLVETPREIIQKSEFTPEKMMPYGKRHAKREFIEANSFMWKKPTQIQKGETDNANVYPTVIGREIEHFCIPKE